MNQIFDFFETSEIPSLVLCTPNKNELFSLSLANGIKNTLRYNAQSGLEFSYPQSADSGVTADPAYEYILGKMLILVGSTTYYTIISAPEDCSGSVPIKAISAISLEAEMLSRRVTGFSGTYRFDVLLQKILDLIPTWTIGTIDTSLLTLYRTFESNNRTVYSFLVEDMEKAYGCIFEFDTLNRTVSAIANTIPVVATNNIYLSFDNLIKSTRHKEVTEELCTALYCYGGEGLDIHYVNPLGTNVIYNFDYFKTTDWMSQELIDALDAWEVKVATQQPIYATKLTALETYQNTLLVQQTDLTDLEGELAAMNDVRAARIEQGLDTIAIDAQIAEQYIMINSKNIAIASTQQSVDLLESELRKIVHGLFFTTKISYENFLEDTETMGTTLSDMSVSWTDTYNNSYPGISDASKTLLASFTTTIASLIVTAMTKMTALENLLGVGYSSYPPVESEINILTADIESEISTLDTLYGTLESIISGTSVTSEIDEIRDILTAYLEIINYSGNMTEEQYLELSSYIYENTYTNSNIIITDSMTPAEIQTQAQELYDQANDKILPKAATPRYEFTGEFSNFVAVEGFSDFTDDLELGSIVIIQKADGTFIGAVLLEIGIVYDNPEDFTMTFSNSFRLDNSSFIYSDFLGAAAQLGSNVTTLSSTSTVVTTTTGSGGTTIITGDGVAGPASSTDKSLARWNGTTGDTLKDSLIAILEDDRMGLGTLTPNANAILDLTSTTKAFLIPRMTSTERDLIPLPTEGMVIYNTFSKRINLYSSSSGTPGWKEWGIEAPLITTDNSILRWDGTSGSKVQTVSMAVIDDAGRMGIGTLSPSPCSILDLTSSTMGFLVPRMSTTQRDAISSPVSGLTIFNVTTGVMNYYSGTWKEYGTSSSGDDSIVVNCTGTNDQIAINAAIASLATYGGRVILTGNTCGLSSSILISTNNITLESTSAGHPLITWAGSAYGTMINISSTSGTIKRIIIRDMELNANASASTFIFARNVCNSSFENIHGVNWAGASGTPGYALKLESQGTVVSAFQTWSNCVFDGGGVGGSAFPLAPTSEYAYGLSIGCYVGGIGSAVEPAFGLNEIYFDNCAFVVTDANTAIGCKIGACDHVFFSNSYFGSGYPNSAACMGLVVAPQKANAGYPHNVTFSNSPIMGGINYDTTYGTYAGSRPCAIFFPYYTADSQEIPPDQYPSGTLTIDIGGFTDMGASLW